MPVDFKNLFFQFRGPSEHRSRAEHERQLEDNATKALVYVLENGQRDQILGQFLRSVFRLRPSSELKNVEFALQRTDIRRPAVKKRVGIALAPETGLASKPGTHGGKGRPDAWIWSDGDFSLFIETKIRGKVSRQQMAGHARDLIGWHDQRIEFRCVTWNEVMDFFATLIRREQLRDGVSRLLVKEFLRYIHMLNVTESPVLDQDDFAFFLTREEDRSELQRSRLMRKLDAFVRSLAADSTMRRVLRAVSGKVRSPRSVIHPGKLLRDAASYWITVGRKERRDRCHFTVRVAEQGLSIEAFSPHKRFTTRLIDKIDQSPSEFVAALHAVPAHEPFVIRLREAHYLNPRSHYKGQRIKHTVDYLQCHSRVITAKNVRSLVVDQVRARLEENRFRPEIFFIRNFRLSELVGESDVVPKVAQAAVSMLPYVEFAGGLYGGCL